MRASVSLTVKWDENGYQNEIKCGQKGSALCSENGRCSVNAGYQKASRNKIDKEQNRENIFDYNVTSGIQYC